MGTSSADPDGLDAWVRSSRALDEVLEFRRSNLVRLFDRFRAGTSWGGVDAASLLDGLARYLEVNESDAVFVETVARAFRRAGDGRRVSVPDATIRAALARAGVSESRSSVTFDSPSAWGAPPTSGYANDPVNTGTGNFVHAETDLAGTGLAVGVGWARTYNSRSGVPGPHGRGWSSWASARLRGSGGRGLWVSPEGQRVEFDWDRSGPTRLPGLSGLVVAVGDGLAVEWFGGGRWSFDGDGRPSLVEQGPGTGVRFTHEEGRLVRLTHEGGRSLALEWAGDRVASVLGSDGRQVRYSYNDDGDLVAVESPSGRMVYELDKIGRIVAVVDADGVAEARNTYDGEGRVVVQESPDGRRARFRYLPGRVTVFDDDSGGPRSSFVHDEAGRLIGIIDDHGAEMTKTYDEAGNPVAVTDRNGGTTVMEWDDRNRLVRRVEPPGAESRYAYDDQDRLVEATAADGGVTRLRYHGAERQPVEEVDAEGGLTRRQVEDGRVIAVSDPDGVTVTFDHDPDGNVVAVTGGDGGRTVLERDPAGWVAATVSPLEARAEVTRDAAGRTLEYRDPTGRTWRYTYTNAGRPVKTVDPVGATGVLRYGRHGRVEEVIDPVGAVTGLRWDPLGQLVGMVTPGGAKWEMRYDGLGRLVSTTDPAGATWLRGYDPEGNLTSTVDPLGTQRDITVDPQAGLVVVDEPSGPVRLQVDSMGRVVRRERADGTAETTGYDRCGRPTAVTDPAGGVTRYTYTAGGRLTVVTSPLGHRTLLGYDPAGRLAEVTDPAGGRTAYRYDGDGRLVEVTGPTGQVESRSYDLAGRLLSIATPGRGTTRYGYDGAGRVSEVTDAVGAVQRFRWDLRGQLAEAVDANGGSSRYEYDPLGLLATVTDQLGGSTRRSYDEAGRLVTATDQLGRSTAFGYDPAGHLTTRRGAGGTERYWRYNPQGSLSGWAASGGPDIRIDRDTVGRPVTVTDGENAVELEWDPLGRLTGKRHPAGTLGWRYDADGRQTALIHPDGVQTGFEHDPVGRLSALHHPALGTVTMTRDAAGRLSSRQSADGQERWEYQHGLLHRHQVERAGQQHHTNLTRDEAGRVIATDGTDGQHRYQYDPAGQLTAAESADGQQTWEYDPAGRLAAETGQGGPARYKYDAAHQLTRIDRAGDATQLTYDHERQRTAENSPTNSRRYQWDQLGRLIAVEEQRGQTTTARHLGYDPLGDLDDINDTPVLWDPTTAIPQLRQVGVTAVLGQGAPLATVTDGNEVRWLDADWQGNLGAPYDPWGAGQPFPLPGGLGLGHRGDLHIGGLTWLRNRTYHPASRAFLSPDPLPGQLGTPYETNPYHYAGNNPINALDPLGLQPLTDADFQAARDAMQTPLWNKAANLVSRAWQVQGGWTGALNKLQTGLDLVGLVPGLGEIADGVNAAIYMARGDYTNAALSGGSMIPFVGWAATGAKFARRNDDLLEIGQSASRVTGTAMEIGHNPRSLFHYTDEAGHKGIMGSRGLNPSLPENGDANFGPGQYLTDIAPERVLNGTKSSIAPEQLKQGFMSRWMLSQTIYTTPWKAPQLTHYVEIDVSHLTVLEKRPGTFLVPGEIPLDLDGRVLRGGAF